MHHDFYQRERRRGELDHNITVRATDTIASVKETIFGIDMSDEEARLIANYVVSNEDGNELDDGRLLQDCGVQAGALLYIQ